jgi:hypothetical protein
MHLYFTKGVGAMHLYIIFSHTSCATKRDGAMHLVVVVINKILATKKS